MVENINITKMRDKSGITGINHADSSINYTLNINMLAHYPDCLTVKDLQKILKTGRNSVYELLNNSIKHKKIGRKYLIPKVFLIEYLLESNEN